MNRGLSVDFEAPADFLVDVDGRPVWPVRAPREARALEELASTFSFELLPTRGIAGRDELRSAGSRYGSARESGGAVEGVRGGVKVVAVVGEECAREGALYAHLTERHSAHFARAEELVASDLMPDVVVAVADRVSAALLDAMHTWSRCGRTPGLITAPDLAAMRTQVLCKAAFVSVPAWAPRARAEVWPYRGLPTQELEDGVTVGRASSDDEVRAVLREGAGVLSISTHSDGFDAPLGEKLILCTLRRERAVSAAPGTGPRCAVRGECHRLDLPVHAPAAVASLVGPDEISARVVVMLACSLVLSRESPTDPAWSLGTALATSPRIGALLAPYGVNVTHSTLGGRLVDDLAAGLSAGDALGAFDHSEPARLFDMRLILLGDPGVCAVRPRTETDGRRSSRVVLRPAPRAPLTPEDLADAQVLRHLALWARSAIAGEAAERSLELLAAIERYEHAYWSRHPSDDVFCAESAVREALFRYVTARGWRWTHDIQDMSDLSLVPDSRKTCGFCGALLLVLRARLPISSAREREVRACRACGAFEDAPVDFELRLERAGRAVVAAGAPAAARFSAGVAIWSQMERENRLHSWSSEIGSRNPLPIPTERPPGPLRVGALWARHTQFALASFVLASSSEH